tara:strand:+ start:745 stop:897 length:153 start_codon:yes stop_codon:yes gene_type:complete
MGNGSRIGVSNGALGVQVIKLLSGVGKLFLNKFIVFETQLATIFNEISDI